VCSPACPPRSCYLWQVHSDEAEVQAPLGPPSLSGCATWQVHSDEAEVQAEGCRALANLAFDAAAGSTKVAGYDLT
jgi:hypothetical protein